MTAPPSVARQPALDQYLPSLPSADGAHAPRISSAPARSTPLPATVRRRLARQPDGALLARLAASAEVPAARSPRSGASRAVPSSPQGSAADGLRAATSQPAVVALLAGLALSVCAVAGLHLRRRRRIRRPAH